MQAYLGKGDHLVDRTHQLGGVATDRYRLARYEGALHERLAHRKDFGCNGWIGIKVARNDVLIEIPVVDHAVFHFQLHLVDHSAVLARLDDEGLVTSRIHSDDGFASALMHVGVKDHVRKGREGLGNLNIAGHFHLGDHDHYIDVLNVAQLVDEAWHFDLAVGEHVVLGHGGANSGNGARRGHTQDAHLQFAHLLDTVSR